LIFEFRGIGIDQCSGAVVFRLYKEANFVLLFRLEYNTSTAFVHLAHLPASNTLNLSETRDLLGKKAFIGLQGQREYSELYFDAWNTYISAKLERIRFMQMPWFSIELKRFSRLFGVLPYTPQDDDTSADFAVW
jgi:hypothetical protein